MTPYDLSTLLSSTDTQSGDQRGFSRLAQSMIPSEILTIAYDVRDRIAAGADILNLTVGDFSPQEFPLLPELQDAVKKALDDGQSNYPPAPGVLELRTAVCELYSQRLALRYPVDSVLIAGGARPIIAGTYLCLINPGDQVVYGIPSWNNDHYCRMTQATPVEIPTTETTNFFIFRENIRPHLQTARLIALNTPQNPTGTVLHPKDLQEIAEMVVEENLRRATCGQRTLYILFDHIYWLLTFDGVEHASPVQLVPECAPYVIHVDGLSKAFAATGLRVGWGVGPPDLMKRMTSVLTHMGAWAPRPEQIATASILQKSAVVDRHIQHICNETGVRLRALSASIDNVRETTGQNITAIAPEGAIYLSIHLDLLGKVRPDGKTITNDEDTLAFLLDEAGVALVPFRGFGAPNAQGWFRASVGTVSRAQCEEVRDRLNRAFSRLT
ncbi:MAG: aminotransferase class I/II-fold pyridoxal phosphate-dependent enzyme [Myxococcales bacterium]|nr:aminotransferase class I/II-fold pyridoxal phosphate-dependent enzyme [Myxococcales bacterium]